MSIFPIDLVTDILCRLPVKTLLRFKCVSKPWGFLIDDTDFAKLHLHHSLKTNANLKLLLDNSAENDDKAYSVDFDSLTNLKQLPRPFPAERTKYVSRIFGSYNGLLAVYHREAGIALWNPSRRKCHYLPSLAHDISTDHDIITSECYYDKNTILGFGYDVINNDYKVVKMLRSKTQIPFKVMIYSLKSDSWKRIKGCPYDIPNNYNDGAYLNGSLHWAGDEIGQFYGGKVIFALDLGSDDYYQIPDGDISFRKKKCGGDCEVFGYMNPGVLGGSLCVSREYSTCLVEDHINLWVMKEYGVKESWTEMFYLSRDEWLTNIFHTRAVGYSRNADRVLLDDGGGRQPAWLNLQNETGEVLYIPGAPEIVSTIVYVETLVSVD